MISSKSSTIYIILNTISLNSAYFYTKQAILTNIKYIFKLIISERDFSLITKVFMKKP